MRAALGRTPLPGLLLLSLGLSGAPIGAEPLVRVLLAEERSSVVVSGSAAGSGGVLVAAAGAGLRADARPVGRVWRLAAAEDGLSAAGLRVRGEVEVSRHGKGIRVVNRVPLEDYVAGTLGREVYPSWESELLKAQAVVARTYALHRGRAVSGAKGGAKPGAYDVERTTSAQVYGGVDAETPSVRAAVDATRGQILSYQGRPILAAYHSASGGQTATAEEVWGRPVPYLVSVGVDNEEDSPDTYWRASISRTKLRRALSGLDLGVGSIRALQVVDRSTSGRVLRLKVDGAMGSEELEGRALRSALGDGVIRSTLFEIRSTDDGFVFVGSGHGHGVGMSQWGAQAMALRGASYREILSTFYPGTRLTEREHTR